MNHISIGDVFWIMYIFFFKSVLEIIEIKIPKFLSVLPNLIFVYSNENRKSKKQKELHLNHLLDFQFRIFPLI